MEKKKASFVKGAAILAVAGLIVKIIGAAFRIPLANTIGSIGASYYDTAYPYYSWLLVISSSGLPTAISKLVSERTTLGDYRGAHKVFSTAMQVLLGIGLFTGIIMFFASDYIAEFHQLAEMANCFRALAPSLFFVSVMSAYRGYLQGMQQMTPTAISQIVEQLGKLAAGLALAYALLPKGPEYAAMGALIGVTISELLGMLYMMWEYRRRLPRIRARIKQSLHLKEQPVARKLLAIALPITIGASISPLAGVVDSALILRILLKLGYSKEMAQTAFSLLRTNVNTLTNMPGVLTMALAMSLVPAISACMAKRDRGGMQSAARLGLKFAIIVGLPCAVGLYVLAEPILSMLYPYLSEGSLAVAADLMRTASIGVIFLSLVQAMTGVIQGFGKPNVPVFNLLIGFALKVVTLLVLMNIPDINIQGAAVSTVVCYAFAGIADTIYIARKANLELNVWDVLLKPLLSSLVMGFMVFMVRGFLVGQGHGTLATLASVAAGVLVYAIAAVYLRFFTREELEYIPGGRKLRRLMYRD
ncbi:MAG: polysaccharide biosynthesis protein [Christensenellaceae bacterium]|nr:polysaccharide biosynthesis protein [Christensenellaceae bacterium]